MNAPADLIVSSDWTYHFRDKVGFPERFGFSVRFDLSFGFPPDGFPVDFPFPVKFHFSSGKVVSHDCLRKILSPENFVSGKVCIDSTTSPGKFDNLGVLSVRLIYRWTRVAPPLSPKLFI